MKYRQKYWLEWLVMVLWQPLDQSPIAIQASKALNRQSSGENHKRTRQGVSVKLESYIYKTCLVHATNN